jgi:hypothetical protein
MLGSKDGMGILAILELASKRAVDDGDRGRGDERGGIRVQGLNKIYIKKKGWPNTRALRATR